MTLDEWMTQEKLDAAAVAVMTGLHRTYVWKVRMGKRKAGPEAVPLFVQASQNQVTHHDMRPDLWPPGFVPPTSDDSKDAAA